MGISGLATDKFQVMPTQSRGIQFTKICCLSHSFTQIHLRIEDKIRGSFQWVAQGVCLHIALIQSNSLGHRNKFWDLVQSLVQGLC
jgi:hypothetical protein